MIIAEGVAEAAADVRRRIADAAARVERDPALVRIVAVTKTHDVDAVRAAVGAGINDIGENRVQEALPKIAEMPNATWHLLGHLQSNKAGRVADNFDVVQSIDSQEIGDGLGRNRAYEQTPLVVLIQVDYTGLPSRSGVDETTAFSVARGLFGIGGIHLTGLMTIAPPGDPERARMAFRSLRTLRDTIEFRTGWELPELSMGMTDDFEIAVEEGATMVRLGRALFGSR